jgi:hypothetical protein
MPLYVHKVEIEAMAVVNNFPFVSGLYSRYFVGDGQYSYQPCAGSTCAQTLRPEDFYLYYDVNDDFSWGGSTPVVSIGVQYYDIGTGNIGVQYDSSNGVYKLAGLIALTNTGTVKLKELVVNDANFSDRMNGRSDLRICNYGTSTGFIAIDGVFVSKEIN